MNQFWHHNMITKDEYLGTAEVDFLPLYQMMKKRNKSSLTVHHPVARNDPSGVHGQGYLTLRSTLLLLLPALLLLHSALLLLSSLCYSSYLLYLSLPHLPLPFDLMYTCQSAEFHAGVQFQYFYERLRGNNNKNHDIL